MLIRRETSGKGTMQLHHTTRDERVREIEVEVSLERLESEDQKSAKARCEISPREARLF